MTDLTAGELIGGRYCLKSMIGEGGMASVWLATDQTLDRPVAIKFLYLKDSRRRDALMRAFLREARIAAAVRHRNVVDILDFGAREDGMPFMVMELLEGETVEDRLDRGYNFSLEEILSIATRVLQGLIAVHDAGIVHRDLKPANIFLVTDRTGVYPKLLDFGISRSLEPDSGRASPLTTKEGHMVGTPEYMSCEQARGLPDIDKRTDIYSMGVILYELITGRLPFQSEHAGDLILQIMTADPPKVAELRPEAGKALSDLIARAMQRDRELRFADAEEMHRALIAIAEQALGSRAAQNMSLPPPALAAPEDTGSHIQISGTSTTIEDVPAQPAATSVLNQPLTQATAEAKKTTERSRGWTAAVAAGAAAVLLGSSALVLAYLWPKPQPSGGSPRYIVIKSASEPARAERVAERQAPDTAASKKRTDPPSLGSPETARGEARRVVNDRGGPDELKPRSSARTERPETQEAKLASAFTEQKGGIEQCFREHDSELERAARLYVRIKLGADGQVSEAQVLPESLAEASIGKCIAQAVLAMKFDAQPEPISFRVPLFARRGR